MYLFFTKSLYVKRGGHPCAFVNPFFSRRITYGVMITITFMELSVKEKVNEHRKN